MDPQQVGKKHSFCQRKCKIRYLVSFLCFWSLLNLYSLRINLSIAMVVMAKTQKDPDAKSQLVCPELAKQNNVSEKNSAEGIGEFDWSPDLQGNLLSGFFYGYFITPMVAGMIATAYGALWVLGLGVLVTGVTTLLIPVAARWSPWALFVARVVVGIGAGTGFPCLHTMIGKWIPRKDRSFQTTLIYNGVPTGNILTLTLSGLLIKSGFLGGWPSVFYVSGFMTCTWFVFWALLVYESPHDHPFVLRDELETIMGCIRTEKPKRGPIPWRAIAFSAPFHALCWTHFCNNWSFYILLTNMPTFLHDILHLHIMENGFVSALPYVTFILFSTPAGLLVDKVRSSGKISITTLRKTANSVACFGPAVCLCVIPYLGCRQTAIILLLMLTVGLNGIKLSGFEVTHIDMSPEFGGLLMSGTTTVANLGGLIAPIFVGQVKKRFDIEKSWKIIFVTTGVIYFAGGIIYLFFGSADLQPWGLTDRSREAPEGQGRPEDKTVEQERPENKTVEQDTSSNGFVDVDLDSKNSKGSDSPKDNGNTSKPEDSDSSKKDSSKYESSDSSKDAENSQKG